MRRARAAASGGLALLAGLVCAGGAAAQARSEVPVREVVLSDLTHRYGVPITVGGTRIEAGLDTGSSGLRILPDVLAPGDAAATSQSDSYSYGAGAKLDGVIGRATVRVGDVSGETRVELVRRVGCSDKVPRCAAGRVALKDYGVQGNGLPGEGFKAILGVNMGDGAAASPLKSLGVRRWIVELPRPGEGVGRIVLNPTDEETQGFVRLNILPQFSRLDGGLHDAVAGCVVNETSHKRICAPLLMDTGAPGVTVQAHDTGPLWPPETPALLILADGTKPLAAARFRTDLRAHASHLTFRDGADGEGRPPFAIYAGLLPYFAWSVLYDPGSGVVAVRPRAPAPGGPTALPPG